MNIYQFTCAVRVVETGELVSINGLITPPVKADTPTEAIRHPDTSNYCADNKCTVYEVVR